MLHFHKIFILSLNYHSILVLIIFAQVPITLSPIFTILKASLQNKIKSNMLLFFSLSLRLLHRHRETSFYNVFEIQVCIGFDSFSLRRGRFLELRIRFFLVFIYFFLSFCLLFFPFNSLENVKEELLKSAIQNFIIVVFLCTCLLCWNLQA